MVPPIAGGARRAAAVSSRAAPLETQEIRLFIALAIPEAIKSAIETVQAQLRRTLPAKAARWTRREQFHLTLKFLGNVPLNRVDELIEACLLACRPHPPLRLTAQKIGFFPNARVPRVVWVGIRDPHECLGVVWKAVQSAAQPFTSEPPEPEFTGHVTLARVSRLRREETEHLAKAAGRLDNVPLGEWTAGQLELVRSELLPEGARHGLVAALPLAGKAQIPRTA